MNPVFSEEAVAELVGLALAVRHDRVIDAHWATQPQHVRTAVRETVEAMAALAYCQEPEPPSAALRERILASARAKQRPAKKALVVIDMINDHLTPGCPLEVPRAREIVTALKTRIAEARAANVPVIYVVDEHEPGDEDLDTWGTHALKGSHGSEVWDELAPNPEDHVVGKPTYSAFVRSNLEQVLDTLGVDTLELTGCLTELGMLATATDAMQRGFQVEIPVATQAGSTPEAEQAAMGIARFMAPYGPARKERLARQASAR
jgi:nicotinamidase-related amidase